MLSTSDEKTPCSAAPRSALRCTDSTRCSGVVVLPSLTSGGKSTLFDIDFVASAAWIPMRSLDPLGHPSSFFQNSSSQIPACLDSAHGGYSRGARATSGTLAILQTLMPACRCSFDAHRPPLVSFAESEASGEVTRSPRGPDTIKVSRRLTQCITPAAPPATRILNAAGSSYSR
jgi:hypothetical protein